MTQDAYELSVQQRHLWSEHPDGVLPVVTRTIAVQGELDPAEMRRRLIAAVARHEVLRTSFTSMPGRSLPLQSIAAEASLELRDGGTRPALHASQGPLVDVALLSRDGLPVLELSAVAAVLDGRSLELLAQELLGGAFDEEVFQYADYAAWQEEVLESATPASALDEDTGLPLAVDGEVSAVEAQVLESRPELLDGLGVPRQDAWLAAWIAVVARCSGAERVIVGLDDHGRASDELAHALGPYARRLTIAVDIPAAGSMRALAAAVAHAREAAEADREALAAARPDGARLGFGTATGGPEVAGLDLATTGREGDLGVVQARLLVGAGEVVLQTARGAIEPAEAGRLAARVDALAGGAAAAPDTDVAALPIVDGQEREWLLETVGSGPSVDAPPLLVERFAAHVASTPDAVALRAGGDAVTYAELHRRAGVIATALAARGAGPGAVVGLLLDRTPDSIAALLGVLWTGAAYLPLNGDHPRARLTYQLQDAGAVALCVDATTVGVAGQLGVSLVRVDQAEGDEAAPAPVDGDDVAYLIYTSGSTGAPKGVETTHAGLANYVDAIATRFGFDAEPLTFAVVGTLSTDLGNTSVFGALATGGCLDLIPVAAAAEGAAYAAHVEDRGIDVLKITPSHLAALLAEEDPRVLPRRRLVVGGEATRWPLAATIRKVGACSLSNHYGPTETTVGSLTYDVGDPEPASATVPVGRPIANTFIRVVDAHGALVPVGAPGELLIGGAGLARGYRGDPERTASSFVDDPFGSGRVYRTGDRVRVLPSGVVEFLSRVDGQVKIRGFRVEVGEVEAALAEDPGVSRVAVVASPDPRGDTRLVAYVVPMAGHETSQLRGAARATLPDYMVPAAIVALKELPLMANGKLDRGALPDPDEVADTTDHVEPVNDAERRLVAIWKEILVVDRVGTHDDFFALGGHSLLATQVVARIRAEFSVQLPLHSLFTSPRIVDLAAVLSDQAPEAAPEQERELGDLLSELEGLSDEEAARLLDLPGGE